MFPKCSVAISTSQFMLTDKHLIGWGTAFVMRVGLKNETCVYCFVFNVSMLFNVCNVFFHFQSSSFDVLQLHPVWGCMTLPLWSWSGNAFGYHLLSFLSSIFTNPLSARLNRIGSFYRECLVTAGRKINVGEGILTRFRACFLLWVSLIRIRWGDGPFAFHETCFDPFPEW